MKREASGPRVDALHGDRLQALHSSRVGADRVRSCNIDVAAACHEMVIGCPGSTSMRDLTLARTRPVVRFNTGPLYEHGPNGEPVYQGEVLHLWTPRR